MTTGYQVDFTDQNLDRRFQLAPYTTNGPNTPNDATLHSKSTAAATTLLLYGKGSPDYGERIQENMVHMLENFANVDEPVYPINGQMWYNRTEDPAHLMVFNSLRDLIIPNVGGLIDPAQWITIDPVAVGDSAAIATIKRNYVLNRLTANTRVRIFQTGTDLQEEYKITLSAALNANNDIQFKIGTALPASRDGGTWYVGGWEYLVQNNAPLHNDLDGDGVWTLKNLPEPVLDTDAATKLYVDTEITAAIDANNSLNELEDVTLISPVSGEILLYNGGTAQWENKPVSDAIVAAGGGTMSGDLDMDGNSILNLAHPPINNNDAATKLYVDSVVGGVIIPTSLDDLIDVSIPTAVSGSMLVFNGIQWIDTTPSAFVTTNNILTKTGGILTGSLVVPTPSGGVPATANTLAHKQYVDDKFASVGGDGVINSLSFDNVTKNLTITTSTALAYITNLAGAAGGTDDITHTIGVPNTTSLFPQDPIGVALERISYDSPTYPDILLDKIIREYSIALGRLATTKPRVVLSVTSAVNTIVDLDAGSVASLIHAPLTNGGSGPYVVGMNRLSVYVNGLKQVGDEHGFRDISADVGLWHGMETGLTGTTTFTVAVNGAAPQTITIVDTNAFRIGNLIDDINSQATDFSVISYDGSLFFYSSLPGTGSSIDVTAGTTFPAIVGNAGTTGAIVMDDPTTGEVNPVTPTDYDYKEIGAVGFESQQFEFNNPLSVSDIVEVIIEVDMFNRE